MNLEDLPHIPSREFTGGTVRSVEDDGSRATVRFRPPAGMINPHGTVQGGFVAAMIDDTVSLATWFAGGERTFVTSSLNRYYLRPVPAGVVVSVTCEAVRVGQRQAVFEAVVQVDGDDRALVKARAGPAVGLSAPRGRFLASPDTRESSVAASTALRGSASVCYIPRR